MSGSSEFIFSFLCSASDKEAVQKLETAADTQLKEWEEDARSSSQEGVQVAQG